MDLRLGFFLLWMAAAPDCAPGDRGGAGERRPTEPPEPTPTLEPPEPTLPEDPPLVRSSASRGRGGERDR